MKFPLMPLAALVAMQSLVDAAPSADTVLYDFSTHQHRSQVTVQDAEASPGTSQGEPALRVKTGTNHQWPGITIKAPAGAWDLADKGQLTVRLRNVSAGEVTIHCRVDNAGADGTSNCVTGTLRLPRGADETLRVALKRTGDDKMGGKLFGMRGYPARLGGAGTVDPSRITQVMLFVTKPATNYAFDVVDLRATGSYTPPTAFSNDAEPFFPLIDGFGQYLHKSWPGKVTSAAELQARVRQEEEEIKNNPGPSGWNKYGGYQYGPKLKATGFFRTEKVKGKWWLVDPEGRLFFSHGIDCVRMANTTPVEERATWFKDFPGDDASLSEFFSQGRSIKGHYAGKTVRSYDFGSANLKRKYGPEWRKRSAELTHRRLRSWGLNTIANWSDETTWLLRKTPYTDNLSSGRTKMIEGSEGYWGKFPDVFDPSFEQALRAGMEAKKGKSAGDPWCIGYFSDNEMSWGDETTLGLAALKSPATQAAKGKFIEQLRGKYTEIGRLNEAWKTSHASWEALAQAHDAPNVEHARADLGEFYTLAAEAYFRGVRDAIRAVSPHQLYLGCRFAWVNQRAAAASAKYCDVVSYNLYQKSVAKFEFNGGADVPLIIGEFHFGALDRGMFHTGLVPVADQNARAQAYKDYVLGALRHPQFVGTHWFQYQDQATTGRVLDEENYQIGFVDIVDTPYPEIIAASRDVAAKLYSQGR